MLDMCILNPPPNKLKNMCINIYVDILKDLFFPGQLRLAVFKEKTLHCEPLLTHAHRLDFGVRHLLLI